MTLRRRPKRHGSYSKFPHSIEQQSALMRPPAPRTAVPDRIAMTGATTSIVRIGASLTWLSVRLARRFSRCRPVRLIPVVSTKRHPEHTPAVTAGQFNAPTHPPSRNLLTSIRASVGASETMSGSTGRLPAGQAVAVLVLATRAARAAFVPTDLGLRPIW